MFAKELVSFRQKTHGEKCHGGHFSPLFGVPAFASIASQPALRAPTIGRRLILKTTKKQEILYERR